MKGELTAVIESAPEGGYWAICPEIPGANGQGETVEQAKESLRKAIILILEDRLEDVPRHTEIKEPLARKILESLKAQE